MGLGKTLQATSIIACSLAEQAAAQLKAETAATGAGSAAAPGAPVTAAAALAAAAGQGLLPSLVVCPSTLVAHWAHEIEKYVGPGVLSPLPILGTPADRAKAQKRLPKHQVAIISYDALRTDVEWAVSVAWDYVILDEGHVIRSTKSKVAQAVKKLVAQHRLILSGTPIQNNALELWSLFDFLMPGFLGSKYGKERTGVQGQRDTDGVIDRLHSSSQTYGLVCCTRCHAGSLLTMEGLSFCVWKMLIQYCTGFLKTCWSCPVWCQWGEHESKAAVNKMVAYLYFAHPGFRS